MIFTILFYLHVWFWGGFLGVLFCFLVSLVLFFTGKWLLKLLILSFWACLGITLTPHSPPPFTLQTIPRQLVKDTVSVLTREGWREKAGSLDDKFSHSRRLTNGAVSWFTGQWKQNEIQSLMSSLHQWEKTWTKFKKPYHSPRHTHAHAATWQTGTHPKQALLLKNLCYF